METFGTHTVYIPESNIKHNTHLASLIICIIMLWLMSSCDMIESSPYDVHITGEKHINQKNIDRIERALNGRTSIRFAMISDTQRFYDETLDAVESINRRDDIDFVLHGGDLTDFGATREFLWQRDILNKLKVPYVCVIGNHDCLATGAEAFQAVFGSLNFAFNAGDVRFLCLNTNAMEFDHSVPVPDFSFIRQEINSVPEDVSKSVVLMHSPPFSEQFDNNIATEFHSLIKQMPDLQFCLYGHCHNLSVDDFFDDGTIYYECTTVKKRAYLVFSINADNTYSYEVVNF